MLHKVTLAHVRASTYRAIVTRTRRQIVLCEIERLLPEAAGRNRIFNCPHDVRVYICIVRARGVKYFCYRNGVRHFLDNITK